MQEWRKLRCLSQDTRAQAEHNFTNELAHAHVDKHADMPTNKFTHKEKTDGHADGRTDGRKNRETGRQTEGRRQTD